MSMQPTLLKRPTHSYLGRIKRLFRSFVKSPTTYILTIPPHYSHNANGWYGKLTNVTRIVEKNEMPLLTICNGSSRSLPSSMSWTKLSSTTYTLAIALPQSNGMINESSWIIKFKPVTWGHQFDVFPLSILFSTPPQKTSKIVLRSYDP